MNTDIFNQAKDEALNLLLSTPVKLAQASGNGEPAPEAVPTTPVTSQSVGNSTQDAITNFGDGGSVDAVSYSTISLFFRADFIVQSVMILLIVASICCWAVIIDKTIRFRRLNKMADAFESRFWSGDAMEELYAKMKKHEAPCPMSAVFLIAMREWQSTITKGRGLLSMNASARIERGMQSTITQEITILEKYMSFLASVGSAAPFIGLFGTVWGIMNSFASIAASKQTSLAVVAPGISEALLATALGLVAAIPASIFYNKLTNDLGRYAARLEAFSSEMSAIFSRQLDEQERE